jgi:hypothetical protein
MNAITPESIQKFFEDAAKANADAWAAQTGYFDKIVKRNVQCFTALADARVASFKEMSESKTFNQAFEANLAFEETAREELHRLQEDSTKAWEALQENMKSIYTPAETKGRKLTPKASSTRKAA